MLTGVEDISPAYVLLYWGFALRFGAAASLVLCCRGQQGKLPVKSLLGSLLRSFWRSQGECCCPSEPIATNFLRPTNVVLISSVPQVPLYAAAAVSSPPEGSPSFPTYNAPPLVSPSLPMGSFPWEKPVAPDDRPDVL